MLTIAELNMFKGFWNNWIFSAVIVFTVIVQFLLVQFGGKPVATVPLNVQQWFFCIIIGALSLPVGFLLRFIPVPPEKTERAPMELPKFDEEPLLDEELESGTTSYGTSPEETKYFLFDHT